MIKGRQQQRLHHRLPFVQTQCTPCCLQIQVFLFWRISVFPLTPLQTCDLHLIGICGLETARTGASQWELALVIGEAAKSPPLPSKLRKVSPASASWVKPTCHHARLSFSVCKFCAITVIAIHDNGFVTSRTYCFQISYCSPISNPNCSVPYSLVFPTLRGNDRNILFRTEHSSYFTLMLMPLIYCSFQLRPDKVFIVDNG